MIKNDLKRKFIEMYFNEDQLVGGSPQQFEVEVLDELLEEFSLVDDDNFEELFYSLATSFNNACFEYRQKIDSSFELPDLILEEGQSMEIPARLHQYNSIHLKKHSVLKIADNSSQWCILWVSGKVVIEGSIIGRKHQIGPRIVKGGTPDGKLIEHEFIHSAIGGSGGAGGSSRGGGAITNGGIGAYGTNMYGGGGGSAGGAIIQGPSSRGGSVGNSASDWRGAPPATLGGQTNGRGGDGGTLGRYSNGGLLFIYCKELIFSGIIHLDAQLSQNYNELCGKNGSGGSDDSPRGQFGASGGGGGAPGGEGGRFVLVSERFVSNINVNLRGGRGGLGGSIVGRNGRGAQGGYSGQDGQAGFADYFTIEQWQASPGLIVSDKKIS